MKWISIFLILAVIAGVIGVSGCTSSNTTQTKQYNVTELNATELANFTDAKALDSVKPQSSDKQLGYNITDYGIKTIAGTKVYYNVYTDKDSPNIVTGNLYFQKNGKWHLIEWKDIAGNPNKADIDSNVKDIINNI